MFSWFYFYSPPRGHWICIPVYFVDSLHLPHHAPPSRCNHFFFPLICRASGSPFFACICVIGGAEAFFGLAFAGIKNIRGSFHPSNPSIHFSASDCVCIRVCARGEGGVQVRGSFSFLSPPATGACIRACVRACCVLCVSVIGMLVHLTVC